MGHFMTAAQRGRDGNKFKSKVRILGSGVRILGPGVRSGVP